MLHNPKYIYGRTAGIHKIDRTEQFLMTEILLKKTGSGQSSQGFKPPAMG